jgi:hypothetical protein
LSVPLGPLKTLAKLKRIGMNLAFSLGRPENYVFQMRRVNMKRKILGAFVVLASTIQTNSAAWAYEDSIRASEATTFCNVNKSLCATPMLTNKATMGYVKSQVDLNVERSNLGIRLSAPKSAIFLQGRISLAPTVKNGGVHEDFEKVVEEKAELGGAYLRQLMKKYAASPQMQAYLMSLAVKGQAAKAAALDHGDVVIDELLLQDTFQELALGYDDGTYFFRIGKFKGGTDVDSKSNISQIGENVADRPVIDELKTTGVARSNVEFGIKDFEIGSGYYLKLVAFVGKEGRVFLNAIQDTSNALNMSVPDFKEDEKLFGINTGGGTIKVMDPSKNHWISVTGMSGPQGPTVGAETRVRVLKTGVFFYAGYLWANKLGARGNQARAQLDIELGSNFGLDWTISGYAEHSQVQRFDMIPVDIDSTDGMLKSNKFGGAVKATKNDPFGARGLQTSAIFDVGYRGNGKLTGPATNFPTNNPLTESDAVIPGGFEGLLNFQIRW